MSPPRSSHAQDCCFAHCEDELSQAPDLTKTSLCAAFMGGHCPLPSGECHYAHGEEELRITPEFINKKLSRRTRDAVVSDTSATSQDAECGESTGAGSSLCAHVCMCLFTDELVQRVAEQDLQAWAVELAARSLLSWATRFGRRVWRRIS